MSSNKSLGKYEIKSLLARGGMGEVWLALSRGVSGFQKKVVIKTIIPKLAKRDEFSKRFIHEAHIAAQLDHPNIVQIFDLGKVDDKLFIVMEYVSGWNLREVARACRKNQELIPPWFLLRVLITVCGALQYAHDLKDEKGNHLKLVHRDITPENIMISRLGAVKVLDFGLVKSEESEYQSKDGMLHGKFAYLSPEQILEKPVDHQSDIFSLGVVMYEMLTGKLPFLGKNEFDTLKKISNCEIVSPKQIAPWIPNMLQSIVVKALAKEPALRYSQVSKMAKHIFAYLRTHKDTAGQREMCIFLETLFPEQPNIKGKVIAGFPSKAPRTDDISSVVCSIEIAAGAGSSSGKEYDFSQVVHGSKTFVKKTNPDDFLLGEPSTEDPSRQEHVTKDEKQATSTQSFNVSNLFDDSLNRSSWSHANFSRTSTESLFDDLLSKSNALENEQPWEGTKVEGDRPPIEEEPSLFEFEEESTSEDKMAILWESASTKISSFEGLSRDGTAEVESSTEDIESSPGFTTGLIHEQLQSEETFRETSPNTQAKEDIRELSVFSAIAKKNHRKVEHPFTTKESSPLVAYDTPMVQLHSQAVEHFENGLALIRSGRYQEALEHWETAIALDPKNNLYQTNIKRLRDLITSPKY